MPGVINKIRLNSGDFASDSRAMKRALRDGQNLAYEALEIGGGKLVGNLVLNEDSQLHLAEQESICEELDKAMASCIDRQRALNNKRRLWLDTKL